MSGFSDSIVDAEGNIRTDSLSKELRAALQEDVRYRQTDNMKKRAVKIAGDYSEFRNMVAAAHLKKLTQKEVESLSHIKKGWYKQVAKDTSSSAQILTKEYEMDQLLAQNSSVGKLLADGGKLKPKTCMEIERDLRRLPSEEEKLRYLYRVGLKRAKSLLASAGDTDLLEQIVVILTANKEQVLEHKEISRGDVDLAEAVGRATIVEHGDSETTQGNPGTQEMQGTQGMQEATDEVSLLDLKLRVNWLKAVAECERCELMVRFAPNALLLDAVELLQVHGGKTESAVLKYQSGVK